MREESGAGTKIWRGGLSIGIAFVIWLQSQCVTRREWEVYKAATREIAEEVKNATAAKFLDTKEGLARIEKKVDSLIERDHRPPPRLQ